MQLFPFLLRQEQVAYSWADAFSWTAAYLSLKHFPLSILCGCVSDSDPSTVIINETLTSRNKPHRCLHRFRQGHESQMYLELQRRSDVIFLMSLLSAASEWRAMERTVQWRGMALSGSAQKPWPQEDLMPFSHAGSRPERSSLTTSAPFQGD